MASMTEILILHGHLPIEYLDASSNSMTDASVAQDLLSRGAITPAQLAQARATQAGVPFIELVDYPVDRTAVATVSGAICKRHNVLPVGFEDGALVLAMADPGDVFAIDDIRAAARMAVAPVVAEPTDLAAAIDRYIRADDELSDLSTTFEEETESEDVSAAGVEDMADDEAPIVRFVNLIVSQAIQDRASDIHIEPGEHSLRVRYRIDGVLHEMQSAP